MAKKEAAASDNEKIAALEKQIGELKDELKEAKGKRAADPDVVDALVARIAELEKARAAEEKRVALPGGPEAKLPPAGDPPAPNPARPAAKKKSKPESEGGNSLYD